MKKWIFVNNITSLEKLYYLTKAVNDREVTKENQSELLMQVLNENGARRNEANNHPINYVQFYNMVKFENGIYKVTFYGKKLLENYDLLVKNKKDRAEFFFHVLYDIEYPNEAVEIDNLYHVFPFRIIFKLLSDIRINKRITINEFEELLSVVHDESDYEQLIDLILRKRNNLDYVTPDDLEVIAQASTVIAGWCNQFCVFKREGEYIMFSDDLNLKLPIISEESSTKKLALNDYFCKFVLYEYLFNGTSLMNIESKYYNGVTKRGFFAQEVIHYFRVNNEANKGIYQGKNLNTIIKFLRLQDEVEYHNIANILEGFDISYVNQLSELDKFRAYYNSNINAMELAQYDNIIKTREDFIKEYPLERLKDMSLEEYAYNVDYINHPSLCYDLATGKYSNIVGIRVGSHGKFGIYMHTSKKAYCGKNDDIVENPEELWVNLRQQIYNFLKDVEHDRFDNLTIENYPLIYNMNLMMTKLSVLYFPDKLLSIAGIDILNNACKLFNVNYDNTQCSTVISHTLNDFIRKNIPEVNDHDSQFIGELLIKYFKLLKENPSGFKDVVVGGYNKIFYGTPGCGKSFQVNKQFNEDEYIVFRTIFHPEYSNSDFVGQILPKVVDNQVEYEFQEGPFTMALLSALQNPTEKVCLIIEEINRGNASAIFGEIFQLLDREDNGRSLYEIVNKQIKDYLHNNNINVEKIYIPSNLWIIATMNTSDQNVFTLDTAFKRRWRMHRIINDFNKEETDDQNIASMYIPGSSYTWEQFVKIIDNEIMEKNPTGLNSEDKQIGVYFVNENELSEKPIDENKDKMDRFIEKVLLYIWNDVAKIDPSLWFDESINTFDKLVAAYYDKKLRVFKNIFLDEIGDESQVRESDEENS